MSWPTMFAAVAVLVGVAGGSLMPRPVETVALAALALAWIGIGASVWRRSAAGVTIALALGFGAIGATAGARDTARAVAPPLRTVFERLSSDGRRPQPVALEGRLQRDAVPTQYGASLLVAVDRAMMDGRAVDARGGLRLTVGGTLVARHIDQWRAGRRVRVPVTLSRPVRYLNPGVPDQERRGARRGTTLRGTVKSAMLVEIVGRGSVPAELAGAGRAMVRRAVAAAVGGFNRRSAAIVAAIVIGDRAGLDETTRRRLQEAGTYHVIAISGGNIAILAALVLAVLRLVGAPSRPACLLTALALLAYAYLVGREASVVRATLGAVTFLVARTVDHRTPPLNSLALAATVMLVATPLTIFDAGFALTFGATVGILIGVPRLVAAGQSAAERWIGREPSWLRPPFTLLAATICAEAALLPISAYTFSRVSFAGIVLNFAAIPLMTLTQIAGLAVIGLAAVHPDLARAAGFVAHLSATGIVESTRLVDAVPWVARRVPPPALWTMGVYYAAWAVWLLARRHDVIRRVALAAVGTTLVWMLAAPSPATLARTLAPFDPTSTASLRVSVLDVGQADAVLVRFPNHAALLVDAAGSFGSAFDVGSRILAPALWALGVRRLDYLALTHGDPDHIGGAMAVLRDFRPREVWEGVPVPRLVRMRAIEHLADTIRAGWRMLQAGDRMRIGGVEVHVWHPPRPDWERQRVRNDDSLVVELRYGDVSILLPGDIGRDVERLLAPRLAPAAIRIVKAPHHGSRGDPKANS